MKTIVNKIAYTYAYIWVHLHPEYFRKGNNPTETYTQCLQEFGIALRDELAQVLKDLVEEMKEAKNKEN